MAYEFTTLAAGTPILANDFSILMQETSLGSGVFVPKKLPALASGFGRIPAKLLVVDGVTHIRDIDTSVDLGWMLRSKGVDSNFCRIRNQSTAGWDYSNGAVSFSVIRESIGTVDFMAGTVANTFTASISGSTMTVTAFTSGIAIAVGQVINSTDVQTGTIYPRTRITALGSGVGGTGTYTVQVSGMALTQTVTSRSMTTGVLILNPSNIGARQDGPPVSAISTETDVWVIG